MNTSMTLVGRTVARNRNELVSIFIIIVRYGARWDLLKYVSALGRDAVVASVNTHYRIDGNCAGISRNRYRLAG